MNPLIPIIFSDPKFPQQNLSRFDNDNEKEK